MDNVKKCRYCGYVGKYVCEGVGPRMGCDMPGSQPKRNTRLGFFGWLLSLARTKTGK
jgi:hypothetical protein